MNVLKIKMIVIQGVEYVQLDFKYTKVSINVYNIGNRHTFAQMHHRSRKCGDFFIHLNTMICHKKMSIFESIRHN